MTQYSKRTIDKAHAILDGVVAISKREMLIHGVYLSHNVVRDDLAARGAVCGGRQACLLGSVALAATSNIEDAHTVLDAVRFGTSAYTASRADITWDTEDVESRAALRRRPAVRLVIEALDAEATARLNRKRTHAAVEARRNTAHPAEAYFEDYLDGASEAVTHREIKALCEGAKARIA